MLQFLKIRKLSIQNPCHLAPQQTNDKTMEITTQSETSDPKHVGNTNVKQQVAVTVFLGRMKHLFMEKKKNKCFQ